MTIISPNHRFIFIHLHKTGGTSVERSFQKIAKWNDLVIGSSELGEIIQYPYKKQFGLEKHNTAHQLLDIVGKDIWNEFQTLTVVRHPISIYKSFFKWSNSVIFWKTRQGLGTRESFKESIKNTNFDITEEYKFLRWGAIESLLFTENFEQFVEYAIRKNKLPGTLKERLSNKSDEIIVKRIFKLEEMENFWHYFSEITGTFFKNIQENKSRNFETPLTDKIRELIYDRHKIDFDYFNYKMF